MLSLFYIGIGLCFLFILISYIKEVKFLMSRNKNILLSLFESLSIIIRSFGNKSFLILFLLIVFIFSFFSLNPYIKNLNDEASIFESKENIILYNDYVNKYSVAAQKQIEEFSSLQAEMSRRATIEQLSFWSEQQDNIGAKLTEQIRQYSNKIELEELNINKRKALINSREKNKWYFYIKE